MKTLKFLSLLIIAFSYINSSCLSQTETEQEILKIDLTNSKKVVPIQYGWHYEEIGMIGEGGLYAEMVRNSAFEEANPPRGLKEENGVYANIPNPKGNIRKKVYEIDPLIGWDKFPEGNTDITLQRVKTNPLNEFNPHSLQIEINAVKNNKVIGIVNRGFFGMNIVKGNIYKLSFYCKAENYTGKLNVALCNSNGTAVSNEFVVNNFEDSWTKYSFTFEADASTENGMLMFNPTSEGKIYLDVVSLFPGDTWDDGKSVFRSDIMKNLIDYNPDFLRFPGGCLVHGVNVETMYHWKETIGDLAKRPGGWTKWSPNYRTDGLGYHEFYELCEYLHCDAMYVTPSGLVCTAWVFKAEEKDEHHHPDVDVQEYIQDALDAIEYAIGPVDSEWGRKRAENGHPKPFPLKYISIGNEDFGPTYYKNYDAFYRAIKAKYPELKIIANSIIGQRKGDDLKRERIPDFKDVSIIEIFDEHYYKDVPWVIENYYKFDHYKRPGPDMFIGELGIRGKHPLDVLGEAVFMMSMERNADLNPLMADRPLMRNWTYVNGRGNPLYYHTNSKSFKTYNYYMSKLFRDNTIDVWYESKNMLGNVEKELNTNYLFSSVGKDSENNELIIKVVNLSDKNSPCLIQIEGIKDIVDATVITLDSKGGLNNTPERPNAIYPEREFMTLDLNQSYLFKSKTLTIIKLKIE